MFPVLLEEDPYSKGVDIVYALSVALARGGGLANPEPESLSSSQEQTGAALPAVLHRSAAGCRDPLAGCPGVGPHGPLWVGLLSVAACHWGSVGRGGQCRAHVTPQREQGKNVHGALVHHLSFHFLLGGRAGV